MSLHMHKIHYYPESPANICNNILFASYGMIFRASVARRKICEFTLQPTSLHRHVKADFQGEVKRLGLETMYYVD